MKEFTINLPGGKTQAYTVSDVPPPTTTITKPDVASLDLSDQGLTAEFLATKPLLKYVTDEQGWVGYLNGLWLAKETPTHEIGSVLKKLEPADIPDPRLAARVHRHLNSKAAVAAVTFFAEARPELGITASEFDPDPMLLGLPDGEVLDLRTGDRRAAIPDDLITRALPVAPKGTCPRWLEYLNQAHPNDEELISYLQRWAGYCLTAGTQEDMILFLIGVGGSGKGTFAEPLQKLLANYCVSIPIGMLLESTNEDRRLNYIASLRGARLAVCNEGSKMQRLDSRGIKLLTGGGWLTGRRLGHQPINFKATHKIVVLANDNPVLELDDAMKQRVHVFARKLSFNQLPQIISERHDMVTAKYRCRPLLIIEDASAGTQAIDVLRVRRPDIPLIPVLPTKSKWERGLSVSHFVNAGMVQLAPGDWHDDFVNELASFSESDARRLRGLPPAGETLTANQLREYRFLRGIRLSESDALKGARRVA